MSDAATPSVRIIGPGRAGGSFALALARVGWSVAPVLGRGEPVADAARGVDVVLIATPDREVAATAASITPTPTTTIVHVAGSLGLGACAPHDRRGAVHPLVALPSADLGAERLLAGAWFGVAGDEWSVRIAEQLGGSWFEVADADRALYHAAACIAANHLVALLGQVERVIREIGAPMEPYLELASGALDNVARVGAAAALTGPAARGDDDTIAAHLRALDPSEAPAYRALVDEARRLAGRSAQGRT